MFNFMFCLRAALLGVVIFLVVFPICFMGGAPALVGIFVSLPFFLVLGSVDQYVSTN